MKGLLFLGMSKFGVKHPAMSLNDCQAVELSGSLPVDQRTEVTPVNLELFSWRGFKTDIGPFFLWPYLLEVFLENGPSPGIALGP